MSLMPVCELWIPNQEGTALELSAASYVGYEDFEEKSDTVTFAKGEGLPGRVWQSQIPEVLTTLDTPQSFVRAEAATEAGLSAGLGLPIVVGDETKAVLTFLYRQGPEPTGIIEVWVPNADATSMVWKSGFYGQLLDIREYSMASTFKKGEGLPGEVWETGFPRIIPSLWPSSDFLREEVAAVAGLTTGFAIPVTHGESVAAVATMLSSSDMPFAKVMEIWAPNESGRLARSAGYYGRYSSFTESKEKAEVTFAPGEGLPGQVWESGMPQLIAPLEENTGFARYEAAQSADLNMAIGIPVIRDGATVAVILLID